LGCNEWQSTLDCRQTHAGFEAGEREVIEASIRESVIGPGWDTVSQAAAKPRCSRSVMSAAGRPARNPPPMAAALGRLLR